MAFLELDRKNFRCGACQMWLSFGDPVRITRAIGLDNMAKYGGNNNQFKLSHDIHGQKKKNNVRKAHNHTFIIVIWPV